MASMARRARPRGISRILCRVRRRHGPRQTARQPRRRQRADQLFAARPGRARHQESSRPASPRRRSKHPALGRASCRWWRRQARCRAPRSSITRTRRAYLFALADALHEEYKAIVDAGLYVQIDDAFLPYMHERMVPPMSNARISALGADADRRAQPRAQRHPRGALALSHLLGQLERPARLRRAAQGHHRSAAAGARRPLFVRGRQSAPRPRMAGVGNRRNCRPAKS